MTSQIPKVYQSGNKFVLWSPPLRRVGRSLVNGLKDRGSVFILDGAVPFDLQSNIQGAILEGMVKWVCAGRRSSHLRKTHIISIWFEYNGHLRIIEPRQTMYVVKSRRKTRQKLFSTHQVWLDGELMYEVPRANLTDSPVEGVVAKEGTFKSLQLWI